MRHVLKIILFTSLIFIQRSFFSLCNRRIYNENTDLFHKEKFPLRHRHELTGYTNCQDKVYMRNKIDCRMAAMEK